MAKWLPIEKRRSWGVVLAISLVGMVAWVAFFASNAASSAGSGKVDTLARLKLLSFLCYLHETDQARFPLGFSELESPIDYSRTSPKTIRELIDQLPGEITFNIKIKEGKTYPISMLLDADRFIIYHQKRRVWKSGAIWKAYPELPLLHSLDAEVDSDILITEDASREFFAGKTIDEIRQLTGMVF